MSKSQLTGSDVRQPEKAPQNLISFRLDDDSWAILTRRAERLKISPNILARHYLLETLADAEERIVLRKAVETLAAHVLDARRDISLGMRTVLVATGNVSEKKAEEWAQKNLYSE